jgi:hypothetical protein
VGVSNKITCGGVILFFDTSCLLILFDKLLVLLVSMFRTQTDQKALKSKLVTEMLVRAKLVVLISLQSKTFCKTSPVTMALFIMSTLPFNSGEIFVDCKT